MKLIHKKRNYSCSTASLAMLLDVSEDDIWDCAGHDGSARVDEDQEQKLPEPACYQGFHFQELMKIAHEGFNTILVPYHSVLMTENRFGDKVFRQQVNINIAVPMQKFGKGLLYVVNSKCGHWVAYEDEMVYDSEGPTSYHVSEINGIPVLFLGEVK